jgi:hypothetical protein
MWHWRLFASWHGVIFQKTWLIICTRLLIPFGTRNHCYISGRTLFTKKKVVKLEVMIITCISSDTDSVTYMIYSIRKVLCLQTKCTLFHVICSFFPSCQFVSWTWVRQKICCVELYSRLIRIHLHESSWRRMRCPRMLEFYFTLKATDRKLRYVNKHIMLAV